jgi:3-hydroxyacyl-[acyl-carrier-protein] dehydratase
MRWDLLEKFEVLRRGDSARAVKTFTGSEDFFAEHFPGSPRVPEPFFVEMIAQCGGVLYGLGLDFQKEVILAKIDDARFFENVAPPCALRVEAVLTAESESGARVSGRVLLGGRAVAEAEILLVAVDGLEGQKQIVFNETFLKHYDVYNVARKSQAAA